VLHGPDAVNRSLQEVPDCSQKNHDDPAIERQFPDIQHLSRPDERAGGFFRKK